MVRVSGFSPVNVLARPGGGKVDQRMPVVGGGGDDDVDNHRAPSLCGNHYIVRCPAIFGQVSRGSDGVIVVHVANGDQVAKTGGIGGVAPADATAADQSDGGAVVWPQTFWSWRGLG